MSREEFLGDALDLYETSYLLHVLGEALLVAADAKLFVRAIEDVIPIDELG